MTEYYIEAVATRTGLTARTLRFWEEKGLLPPPLRSEGGLRLYSEADVARLERIRDLRDVLGLSLGMIGQLLAAEDQIDRLCHEPRQHPAAAERLPLLRQAIEILAAQVQVVEERSTRLRELQAGYEQRLTRWRHRVQELEAEAGF